MGMGMNVLRMTREGLRACPPDVGSSGVPCPRLERRVVVRQTHGLLDLVLRQGLAVDEHPLHAAREVAFGYWGLSDERGHIRSASRPAALAAEDAAFLWSPRVAIVDVERINVTLAVRAERGREVRVWARPSWARTSARPWAWPWARH